MIQPYHDENPTSGGTYRPVANRTAALKALGNAIVPQVAMEIFRAIKETDNG